MKTLKREEVYQAKLVFGELKFKDVWKKVKKDVICIAFIPSNENMDGHRLFKFIEEKYKNKNVLKLISQGIGMCGSGIYYIRMNNKIKIEGKDKIEVEVLSINWRDPKKRKIKFLCSMDLLK